MYPRIHFDSISLTLTECLVRKHAGNKKGVKTPVQMTYEQRMSIAVCTVKALAFMHAKGLVHRDVKSSNILIANANGSALLGDFGLCVKEGDCITPATGVAARSS